MCGSWILIQPASLYLVLEELRPLTFSYWSAVWAHAFCCFCSADVFLIICMSLVLVEYILSCTLSDVFRHRCLRFPQVSSWHGAHEFLQFGFILEVYFFFFQLWRVVLLYRVSWLAIIFLRSEPTIACSPSFQSFYLELHHYSAG